MVSRSTKAQLSLDVINEVFDMRFEYDDVGRIVGVASDSGGGGMPRFVLGRSQQGCIWRFPVGLDPAVVVQVAKLAGREPAFPSDSGQRLAPPERWVMIERLFGVSEATAEAVGSGRGEAVDGRERSFVRVHEIDERGGEVVGDLWMIH